MRTTLMLEERWPDDTGTATPDVDTSATVFPAPLTTIIAALAGGLLGTAAVYGVASRLAGSLTAVAAIIMVFAVTLAGPRVHAAARTELGRTVAVVLQAIGFGGVVGALVIAA
ncbi:hypothetical protein [Dietzia sp. B32]|uniref:hypothetical protein n=1 Tax=Dietzia sp. B32 TaxID=2915130 RepID=UPI0021ADC845|nr:hypothetical protein [Dietzia sp. B32]UVE94132.1 hypothetical protein L8M95_11275 [Dietzia sp. B32]